MKIPEKIMLFINKKLLVLSDIYFYLCGGEGAT